MQQQVQQQPMQQVGMEPSQGDSRTLWMGAIQPQWDEAYIMSLFQNDPNLLNVKLMRNPASNLPAGYAFLEFASHEAASNVLNTYNGQPIPDTAVFYRLNWGNGARKHPGGLHEYSLFVGDLSPEVTDAMLQEAFASRFPACSNAKVVTDPNTGGSKGYGFVRFTDKGQCDEALQVMNGVLIGSRAIRVDVATVRRQDRGGFHPQMHQVPMQYAMGSSRGAGGYRAALNASSGNQWMNMRHSLGDIGGQLHIHQQHMPTGATGEDSGQEYTGVPDVASQQPENTTVFVGNLDPSVTEEQLGAHFQSFGNIVQIKIPPNRGCGFVKFEIRESAEKAIAALHNSILSNQRIRLDWGKASASRYQPAMGALDHTIASGYPGLHTQPYYLAHWTGQPTAYYGYGTQYMIPQQHLQQQQPSHMRHLHQHTGMFQQSQLSEQATGDMSSASQSLVSNQQTWNTME